MSNLSDFISAGEKLTLGSYTKSTITGASTTFSLSSSAFIAATSTTAFNGWKRFAISHDGLHCVVNNNDDMLYGTFSTAWDVTTLGTTYSSYNMAGLQTISEVTWNADGSKMFVSDTGVDKVISYDLSTNYDPRTADQLNRTELDISGDTTSPYGITFHSSGTKMIISNGASNNFLVYTLSTGYDISTAGSATTVSAITNGITSIDFSEDGYWCLAIVGGIGKTELWELSTAYDLSTASVDSDYTNTTYGESYNVQWDQNSYEKFFTFNLFDGDDINAISVSKNTAPDAVQSCTLDLSSGNTFVINNIYGFRNTIIQTSNAPASGSVEKYNVLLPVPDNSLDQIVLGSDYLEQAYVVDVDLYIHASITSNVFMHFTNNGKYLHLLDAAGFYYRYTLPRPYDLLYFTDYYFANSTKPEEDEYTDLDPNFAAMTDPTYAYLRIFYFDNDGTFVLAIEDNKVKKITMPASHSLAPPASAQVIQEFTPTGITAPTRAFMTPDGVYLYTFDVTNDKATNYKLSRPFDLTSASLHSTATTLDIRDSYTPQVMSTGEALIYNYDYTSTGNGIYARTMSTNHDLSTLSAESFIIDDNYVYSIKLTPDDATLFAGDDQSGQRFFSYRMTVVRPTITLDDNIYPTDDVKTVMHVNKATKFNLLTADGGTTVIAY